MPRSPSLRPLRAQSRHGAPPDNPAVDWSQHLLTAADIALLGLNITAETLNGIPFLKGIVVAGSEIIRRARDASTIKKYSDSLAQSIQQEVALVVDKLCNNEKTMDPSLEQDVDGLLSDLIAVYSDLKKLKNGYFGRFWTLDCNREALQDCKRAIDTAFKNFQMRTSLASQQRQIQNHEEIIAVIAAAVHTLQQSNASDPDEASVDTDAASGYSYDRPMFPGEEPDVWDIKLSDDASDESPPYVSWVRRVVKVADGIMTGVKVVVISTAVGDNMLIGVGFDSNITSAPFGLRLNQ
ncbi:hypothetical protein EWM64_g7827 [Hericium alpestre]|uniref:Uncharacterized protein n=1 Tax=Hericium alpestre TaxID=135208 RepID=A0A4Y9ZNJ6_9AGAM|nr:hypothetical protein EWM64_g7827 [Hericium alpestre]